MKKSLGLIEVTGLSTGISVADTMAKTANISVDDLEITRGLGFVTIKIVGDVAAVTAAISAGKKVALANGKEITAKVIARPNDAIEKTFLTETKKTSKQSASMEVYEKKSRLKTNQETEIVSHEEMPALITKEAKDGKTELKPNSKKMPEKKTELKKESISQENQFVGEKNAKIEKIITSLKENKEEKVQGPETEKVKKNSKKK